MSHSEYSPSAAHRRVACPGSLAAEHGRADNHSRWSEEGTVKHWLAAHCLRTGADPAHYLNATLVVWDNPIDGTEGCDFEANVSGPQRVVRHSECADSNLVEQVRLYVDAVRARREHYAAAGFDVHLDIEITVPIDHVTGEPGGHGTLDAALVGLNALTGDTVLEVCDAKFGHEYVEVADNDQLLLYAAGALRLYDVLGLDADTRVVLTIHQPRLLAEPRRWTTDVAYVAERAALHTAAARRAFEILREAAAAINGEWPAERVASEKACRWCKALPDCPAAAEAVGSELVGRALPDDAVDLTGRFAEEVRLETGAFKVATPASLAAKFRLIPLLEHLVTALRGEVERRLLAGEALPGLKLVRGRAGNRKWDSTEVVEQLLRDKFRLKSEDIYERKLIGPPTAEKLLKSQPKRWAQVAEHITRTEGALSVATVEDPRAPVPVEQLEEAADLTRLLERSLEQAQQDIS